MYPRLGTPALLWLLAFLFANRNWCSRRRQGKPHLLDGRVESGGQWGSARSRAPGDESFDVADVAIGVVYSRQPCIYIYSARCLVLSASLVRSWAYRCEVCLRRRYQKMSESAAQSLMDRRTCGVPSATASTNPSIASCSDAATFIASKAMRPVRCQFCYRFSFVFLQRSHYRRFLLAAAEFGTSAGASSIERRAIRYVIARWVRVSVVERSNSETLFLARLAGKCSMNKSLKLWLEPIGRSVWFLTECARQNTVRSQQSPNITRTSRKHLCFYYRSSEFCRSQALTEFLCVAHGSRRRELQAATYERCVNRGQSPRPRLRVQ